ncbi:MAG: helix-turn-helix domain-containing protein [Verrucomicrobiales bacterium]|nr:helix-turn-helix domain-containing protein [Verrucomicrobiales bacterium]
MGSPDRAWGEGILLNWVSPSGLSSFKEERKLVTDKLLLTTSEIAEKIGVSPRTIQNWVSEDIIPSIKIGKTRRFISDEVMIALKKFKA